MDDPEPQPGTDHDLKSGDYQFTRALQSLSEAGSSDDEGDRDALVSDMAEAGIHAVLALAAYTRDLAAALQALAGEPKVPVSKLAELAGDIADITARRRQAGL